MKEPLKCLITANVCKITSRVIFINSMNEQIDLQTDKVNIIESRKLMLKKLTVFKFEIINMGDIAFKYEWDLGIRMPTKSQNNKLNYKIEIKEANGEVDSRSKIITFMEITAMKKLELKNHPITLKVHSINYFLKYYICIVIINYSLLFYRLSMAHYTNY